MCKVHFVTFATPGFRVRQWLLNRSARWFGGVDVLDVWTKARLAEDGFLARHPELFVNSKGFGWYAWKPYVILQALQQADEGDLVIYQDTGRREPVLISRSLREWDAYLTENNFPCIAGVSIPNWGPNRLWTKRSVFKSMGLQGERYENSPQVQASWSVWRKGPQAESLVAEWTQLCQRLDLVGGQLEHGPAAEVPGFHEHRWDQSLLTLLVMREHLPVLDCATRPSPVSNEKSIDSFSRIPRAVLAFKQFARLARLYYTLELAIKRLGIIRLRHPAPP